MGFLLLKLKAISFFKDESVNEKKRIVLKQMRQNFWIPRETCFLFKLAKTKTFPHGDYIGLEYAIIMHN